MGIERKFIEDNLRILSVKEFLHKELERPGCGEIDIKRTPQGTRIIINAQRPGLVIGRKGATIKKLTSIIHKKYKIDNPQIEVNELQISELNADVMAKNIASSLERGIHFRRVAYMALRRIMGAGARGAQIEISGKLTGDRSKSVKFTDGYLKHCGDPALMYVRKGISQSSPKQGVLGVKVMIMPPGIVLPDDIEIIDPNEVRDEKLGAINEEKVDELKSPDDLDKTQRSESKKPVGKVKKPVGKVKKPVGKVKKPVGKVKKPVGKVKKPVGKVKKKDIVNNKEGSKKIQKER